MARRARIRRCYSIVVHDPDNAELRYGVWNPVSFTLSDDSKAGRLASALLALREFRQEDELAHAVGMSRGDAAALYDELASLGALEEIAASALDHYVDQQVPALRADPGIADRPRRIILVGDSELVAESASALALALPEVTVERAPPDDPHLLALDKDLDPLTIERHALDAADWADAVVAVFQRVIHPPRLLNFNLLSLRVGFPWIHAAIDGPFVFAGPLMIPRRTACFACFETRVLMNLREAASYQRYKEALVRGDVAGAHQAFIRPLIMILAGEVALEMVNFCTTGNGFTVGAVHALYLPLMEHSFSEVFRLPGCPACGSSAERDEHEPYFDMRAMLDRSRPVSGRPA
jgi:bacteriocin biosynthesis cyclodehydratase domain-containing protein